MFGPEKPGLGTIKTKNGEKMLYTKTIGRLGRIITDTCFLYNNTTFFQSF